MTSALDRATGAAARRCGGRHDIRDFHDAYLRGGALPLDVLERSMLAAAAQEERA